MSAVEERQAEKRTLDKGDENDDVVPTKEAKIDNGKAEDEATEKVVKEDAEGEEEGDEEDADDEEEDVNDEDSSEGEGEGSDGGEEKKRKDLVMTRKEMMLKEERRATELCNNLGKKLRHARQIPHPQKSQFFKSKSLKIHFLGIDLNSSVIYPKLFNFKLFRCWPTSSP
ncbi:Protein CBG03255 [Caenorhabditis briggsae]|uniref:Protein CBG03255 n=1 Tax=Caenorhabditis briggsae TaxID=6238 RepID=A8WSG1_CAEBR|nr:Protein CBG03255 [Caenorhabditis briggsae]CAP23420.1 Protein CBG03255 [Caenorhabditis briggsae]